jgi:hypothetical protein
MDTGHEPFVERNEKPDWDLIGERGEEKASAFVDEVSLCLLAKGIGAFDVLQQTLATIVLSRIDPQVIGKNACSMSCIASSFAAIELQCGTIA